MEYQWRNYEPVKGCSFSWKVTPSASSLITTPALIVAKGYDWTMIAFHCGTAQHIDESEISAVGNYIHFWDKVFSNALLKCSEGFAFQGETLSPQLEYHLFFQWCYCLSV